MSSTKGATSPDNPGHILASAVDAEISKYRVLQSEVEKLQSDLQVVLSQETETEMVTSEMNLCQRSDDTIYKMIGPVLIKQDVEESIQTVKKRLEFIRGKKEKITSKIIAKEKQSDELSNKIQAMQAQLQQTTAAAVRAIAEQHKSS